MKKKNTLTWHWTNLGQLKQTSGSSRLSGGLMSRGLTSDAQPELRHKHLFSQRKCLSAVLLWFLFFLSFFLTVTLAVRRGCFPLLSVLINTLLFLFFQAEEGGRGSWVDYCHLKEIKNQWKWWWWCCQTQRSDLQWRPKSSPTSAAAATGCKMQPNLQTRCDTAPLPSPHGQQAASIVVQHCHRADAGCITLMSHGRRIKMHNFGV